MRGGFNSSKVTMFVERNELEKVLQDCISEVKRQVTRRRIRQEMTYNNKSKPMNYKLDDLKGEEAAQFEEAIVKLVNYAKGKTKYEEFTSADKYNLTELFVTNERTLLYIYRSLFQQENKEKTHF